jgi:hypothetical protein
MNKQQRDNMDYYERLAYQRIVRNDAIEENLSHGVLFLCVEHADIDIE